jgi:hypothetical protein
LPQLDDGLVAFPKNAKTLQGLDPPYSFQKIDLKTIDILKL